MNVAHSQKALAEELGRLLEAWGRVPVKKRVAYSTRLGDRDANGEFTVEFDGSAQPDDSSLAALVRRRGGLPPVLRLVWFLRHTDTLCLDATTARIVAAGGIDELVATIRDARAKKLVVRYNDQGTAPVEVDPVAHRDHVIGLRLTDLGLERAKELEHGLDKNLPVESLAI